MKLMFCSKHLKDAPQSRKLSLFFSVLNFEPISVVFRESVRKNAWDCFEKKGFAGNRHFQGTANFGYLDSIKCHFEARKWTFRTILTRIQSNLIFCLLHFSDTFTKRYWNDVGFKLRLSLYFLWRLLESGRLLPLECSISPHSIATWQKNHEIFVIF